MITRRKYIGTMAASLAAAAFSSGTTASQQKNSKSLSYNSDGLTLHIEKPEQDTEIGVLLVPRIYGLDQGMINTSKEIAEQGMTAVVWDPYQGEEAPVGFAAIKRSRELQDEAVLSNLKKALDYMLANLGVKKVAVIGWCLGGRFALLLGAKDNRIQSITVYHPTIYPIEPTKINARAVMPSKTPKGPAELIIQRSDSPGQSIDEFAAVAAITCPVRVIRPGHDLMQAAEYERLFDILNQRSAATYVEHYPKASHGFSSRQEFEANAKAYKLSWPMTLTFVKSSVS